VDSEVISEWAGLAMQFKYKIKRDRRQDKKKKKKKKEALFSTLSTNNKILK
jgi:hypothetical protein